MSPQYGELRPTSGCDRLTSLWYPCKFQLVSRLGSVTARHSSSGRQPNFAALNRGRYLYSAGRPSRWALAHIYSCIWFVECYVIVFLVKFSYVKYCSIVLCIASSDVPVMCSHSTVSVLSLSGDDFKICHLFSKKNCISWFNKMCVFPQS